MNIFLTDISGENGKTIVTAENELGRLRGVWHFREAPVKDGTYNIELTFKGGKPIDAGSAQVLKDGKASFSADGGKVTFEAKCEDIDDDGLIYLRFSVDGLELLDIANAPQIKAGDYIRFTLDCGDVGIYPY